MIVHVSPRGLRALALLGAFAAVACSDLGSRLESAKKAADYGQELAACQANSTSWDNYEPCCMAVARRNHRDPSFCLRENDPDRPGAQPMVPDAPAKDGGK